MIDGDGDSGGGDGVPGLDPAPSPVPPCEAENGVVQPADAQFGVARVGPFEITRDGIRIREISKEAKQDDHAQN